MTLSEQSAFLLEAIKDELLQPEDVIKWANMTIEAMEKPPIWVIELLTLSSSHKDDFVPRLREQASAQLSVRRQIQVIILAHNSGLISLLATLSKLFRVVIFERGGRSLDTAGEQLADALVDWDCQEDLDVIEPPLQAKFAALFREFLTDADDIAKILPWKFKQAVG